ncbi:MAG: BamA/TamA family outer membrane protein [Planctomycetes bacterium]|nr:BamA/TamA family outer membrane protein [Planctomycetota bacterium]
MAIRPALALLVGFVGAARMACAQADRAQADSAGADASQPASSPQQFDPLRGMDASGRIPKKKLPDDIPNPERWRYTPEGRLKPGNVFERFLVSSFVTPIVFKEKDVGTGGGFALTDINFRDTRMREFANVVASQTTEGQESYRGVWRYWIHHRDLPDGGIIREERSTITARAGFERTLTRRFYGLGSGTTKDDESSYTDEEAFAGVDARLTLPDPGSDWVVGFGIGVEHHNLMRGRVTGIPSTHQAYGRIFRESDDIDALFVAPSIRYDTRDSQANPYRGWTVGLRYDAAPFQTAGRSGGVATADGSFAVPLPPLLHDGGDSLEENPPTDTFGVGAFLQQTSGNLPFYDLPSLGGSSTLRGFVNNRFTDRAAWHASAEYRFWPVPRGFAITDSVRIERVGLALFYDVGTVASDLGQLGHATIHDSYGAGLRIGFAREAIFRLDLGYSDEGSNFSIAFGLSF